MTSSAPIAGTLRARLPWILLAVELFLFAGFGAVFYSPVTPHAIFVSNGAITGFWLFPFVSFGIAGAVLASRRPDNPLGWLCLGSIGVLLIGAVSALAGSLLASAHDGASAYVLPLSVLWNAPAVLPLAGMYLAVLIFPDGRLPSRRWRWLVRGLAVVVAAGLVVALISPEGTLGMDSNNSPIAIAGARGIVDAATPVISGLGYAAGLAAVVSLFLRLRGADAERRHQIRWVAFGAAIAVVLLVSISLIPVTNSNDLGSWTALVGALLVVAGTALPTSIAVAVLKYRLYDIDLVISRTLVYGALAAMITAVYVGIAVGVGALVGGGGRPNLGLSILATAIVAVGFQPVRERLQHLANRLVYGRRATPYEVLSQFAQHAAVTYAADEVLPQMARVLREGSGAESATVWLRSGDALRPAASDPDGAVGQESMPLRDGAVSPPSGAMRVVEVRHRGELLGALSIVKRRGESVTPIEEKLIGDLAHQAGLVLKNVGLTADLQARLEELRASRQRLVAAQDDERRRLERNLHDGAQQHLVALKVKLGIVEMLARKDPDRTVTAIAELKADADEALATLRDLAHGIYPPLLAEQGLKVALQAHARKLTMPVEIDADGITRYSQEAEAAVYFCCLEALQNAQKYAGASRVDVSLRDGDGTLRFAVADDGRGFDTATANRGAGMTNMRDRLDALGGTLELVSAPGRGAQVIGCLPVQPV
ncbi:MAG TPA: sensor histidine kinase [Candidatus Dormibacteraeota bacterium]|nr:sensor histidine kinase [Candidatus Dormibacteraeota bacterium]